MIWWFRSIIEALNRSAHVSTADIMTLYKKQNKKNWNYLTVCSGLPNLYTRAPGPSGYIYSNPPTPAPNHHHQHPPQQPQQQPHVHHHVPHQPHPYHIQQPLYYQQPLHPQHPSLHPGQHPAYHPVYGHHYGTYGPSGLPFTQNGSKRSSIASLAAIEQGDNKNK